MTTREARASLHAYVETGRVFLRAGRRALSDAIDATRRLPGFAHGLRTWKRLVVADLSTLIAVDEVMMEATSTGEVKEQVRR